LPAGYSLRTRARPAGPSAIRPGSLPARPGRRGSRDHLRGRSHHGEFRVNDSGDIALPLIGSIQASGLSTDSVAARVTEALQHANLLRAPSVVAEVVAYRPIFVLGEVSKPGQYPYQPGMTVVTAAAVAGGFTYRAIDAYAAVVRTQDGVAMEGKATRHSFVQPGDVITIFERRF
jgi:polysaccharide biosynthesis/export protein